MLLLVEAVILVVLIFFVIWFIANPQLFDELCDWLESKVSFDEDDGNEESFKESK